MKIAAYILFQDLGLGDFVLVKLANPKLYHVWMGKAESEVMKDENCKKFRHLHIQWWVPLKKGAKNDRLVSRLLGEQMEMQFGKSKIVG